MLASGSSPPLRCPALPPRRWNRWAIRFLAASPYAGERRALEPLASQVFHIRRRTYRHATSFRPSLISVSFHYTNILPYCHWHWYSFQRRSSPTLAIAASAIDYADIRYSLLPAISPPEFTLFCHHYICFPRRLFLSDAFVYLRRIRRHDIDAAIFSSRHSPREHIGWRHIPLSPPFIRHFFRWRHALS
jgi:hypothetical protein